MPGRDSEPHQLITTSVKVLQVIVRFHIQLYRRCLFRHTAMALLLQRRAIWAASKPKPERVAVRVNATASRRTVLSVPFLLPLLGNASTAFAEGEGYVKFLGEKGGGVLRGAITGTRTSVGDRCQVITTATRALRNTKHL